MNYDFRKNKYLKNMIKITLITMAVSSCATNNTNKNLTPLENSKLANKTPFLTAPKVRKIWIPEKIENDKFIEGHYVWILEKTSSWSQ